MQNNLLEIKKLKVWYQKNKIIIKDLDINIPNNKIIGLIGLNGAGKTTLFNTICGIHEKNKYTVDSIKYNDKKINFTDKDFKKDRFIVFSEDESFQYFTFNEYIKYTFKCYGKKINNEEIDYLCKELNFTQYRNIIIRKLSLGNKRKVHLITGLALHCKLLIFDEPFNGIDFESTEKLYNLLKEYKNHGSIIFSSHILETICMITDEVYLLENGNISNTFDPNKFTAENIRKEVTNV